MLRRLADWVGVKYIRIKWYFFGDYYGRLAVQARYIYRQSEAFKTRWEIMGMRYAEEKFDGECMYYFRQAKKAHIVIRAKIMLDSIQGRDPRPYAMRDDSIF